MNRGHRGRGRGGDGGGGRGRGRGGRGGGRGRSRGRGVAPDLEVEREIQILMANPNFRGRGGSGRGTPNSNGRFARQSSTGNKSSFGRGLGFPIRSKFGFGATIYNNGQQSFLNNPNLSNRPLLRPIKFVPSSTGTLFRNEEDIFEPEIVDVELDHAPTASIVANAFAQASTSSSTSSSDNEFEESRVHDLLETDNIFLEQEAIAFEDFRADETQLVSIHATFTSTKVSAPLPPLPLNPSFYLDGEAGPSSAPHTHFGALRDGPASSNSAVKVEEGDTPGFIIDTQGGDFSSTKIQFDSWHNGRILGEKPRPPPLDDEDDEIIVFIPPTSSRATPQPQISRPVPTIDNLSLSITSPAKSKSRQPHPDRKEVKKSNRLSKLQKKKEHLRGTFGVEDGGSIEIHGDRIPRIDDSDIEWGSDGPPGAQEDSGVDDLLGGMSLDPELAGSDDQRKMMKFLSQMQNGGGEVVTIADLADAEKMRLEDEDEEGETSDEEGEDDELIDQAEREMLGEESSSSESDISEDDDDGSFQTRLAKLRAKSIGQQKGKGKARQSDSDEDDGDVWMEKSWAEEDDGYIAHIQDILDKNVDLLEGRRNRSERNKLFRAIEDGDFGEFDPDDVVLPPGRKKKKDGSHVPVELRDQWQRDRAKKADSKRERAEARLLAELDPFPKKAKGKGKGKSSGRSTPANGNRSTEPITDLFSLTRQIRAFLSDLHDDRSTMILPPMDKESRRRVHLIADCFTLKSVSKGKGKDRYTTLIKTTRSGLNIKEDKVEWILRGAKSRGDRGGFSQAWDRRAGDDGKKEVRHRDGDVIGAKAEKLDASNIGFKLLQQMGWSEGDTIGRTGVLVDPLKAIMKSSKLGLGATR